MINWEERLTACVEAMHAWPADLMIQMGDLVNGRFVLGGMLVDAARIPAILETVDAVYAHFTGPRYYVLGNHDLFDLTKDAFLERVAAEQTFLSFDAGSYHIVILDVQSRADGSDRAHEFWYMPGFLPPQQLDWLRADLAEHDAPTIVCLHQRLDLDYHVEHGGPEVTNHLEVRDLLVEDGDVIAVFQGHDHEGGYSRIDGIHYVTFRSLMDRTGGVPPTWAHVTLDPDQKVIRIVGEGEQEDYELPYGDLP
jgi:alkaline phosphatase